MRRVAVRGLLLAVAVAFAGCGGGTPASTGSSGSTGKTSVGTSSSGGTTSGGTTGSSGTTGSGSTSGTTGVTHLALAVTPATTVLAQGTSLQFNATEVDSDGSTHDVTTTATWSTSDATLAASQGAGLVKAVAAGSVTVKAQINGLSATASVTVTAAKLVSLAITPPAAALAVGTSQQLSATGTFSDGTTQDLSTQVSWNSSDTTVAGVSTNGLVQAAGAGTSTITATDATTELSATATVVVTSATLQSIAVTPETASIAVGTQQRFLATGSFSDGTTQDLTSQAAWSSSDDTVATVSNASGQQGEATGVAAGSATVTATVNGVSGTANLTVTDAVLMSLELSPASATLAKGGTQSFTATGTFSDGTTQDLTSSLTWASSDATVLDISNASGSEGQATALAAGSVTVTATDATSGVSGSASVVVTNAVLVSLEVDPQTAAVPLGGSQPFTALGTYSDGSTAEITTSVTWSTADSTVATISNASGSRGVSVGAGVGTTTVTATDPVTGVSGTASLEVDAATLVSIAVGPATPSIPLGATQAFTAKGTFSDGTTQDLTASVSWDSSDTSVASIDATGLATSAAVGSTTISATQGSVTGSTTLTVSPAALSGLVVTPGTATVAAGVKEAFSVSATFSDGSQQDVTSSATWSSSDGSVATISNATGSWGVATTLAAGDATITATYGGQSATATLHVTAQTLVSLAVTPTGASIFTGAFEQYAAEGTFSDGSTQDLTTTVTWNTSDSAVAAISNASGTNGQAQGVAAGSATITATLGSVTSNSASLSVEAKALVSIAITPNPLLLTSGTAQLTAIGTYNDGTSADVTATASWVSDNTSAFTVASGGLVTFVSNGSANIYAIVGSVSGSVAVQGAPKVLILAGDDQAAMDDVKAKLGALNFFPTIDEFSYSSGTPTLAQLQQYGAVLMWANTSTSNPSALGDVVADYFDSGGTVVIMTAVTNPSFGMTGRFGTATNGYVFVGSTYAYGGANTLGTVAVPSSPLMQGVTTMSWSQTIYVPGGVINGGTVVASYSDGNPLVVTGTKGGRNLVDLCFFGESSTINTTFGWNGDAVNLIRNALLYK